MNLFQILLLYLTIKTVNKTAPAIQFIHILICFHWHMAHHQLCIIIIIIIRSSLNNGIYILNY